MEVNPGMGVTEPRVRLAFYRTKFYPQDQTVTCTFCGTTLPKYIISCPHSRIGCEWSGSYCPSVFSHCVISYSRK
jgi:hypothetical protein